MNITERRLIKDSGSEGPRHDPYGWDESTVRVNGHSYTLRQGGLGYTRLIVDGKCVAEGFADYPQRSSAAVEREWQALTGLTERQFDRAYARIRSRCTKCGSRSFYWVAGYPGESFCLCTRCDAVVDSHFNRGAIE